PLGSQSRPFLNLSRRLMTSTWVSLPSTSTATTWTLLVKTSSKSSSRVALKFLTSPSSTQISRSINTLISAAATRQTPSAPYRSRPRDWGCPLKSGDVLWFASLHGGLTVEAVHKELYPCLSVKSAEKAIAEVRDHLRAIPFRGKKTLYTLNRKGRRLCGLP